MVSKTRSKGNEKKMVVFIEYFNKKKEWYMRKLCCLIVLFSSVVLFSGICYPNEGKAINEFSDVLTIEPDKFYEKCIILQPRQEFYYKFDASSPVYFNIHYHGEQGHEYMIQKKEISSLEKTITEFQYKKAYKGFSKKASLCMLWKNNTDGPVELSLDCVTSKK